MPMASSSAKARPERRADVQHIIIIKVAVDAEPTLVDPHEIARDMVDAYNDGLKANGQHDDTVEFDSAEWSD